MGMETMIMGARIVVSRKFLPWKAAAYTRYVYRVGIGAERRGYVRTYTYSRATHARARIHGRAHKIHRQRAPIYLRWDVMINMTFEKFSVSVFRERSHAHDASDKESAAALGRTGH